MNERQLAWIEARIGMATGGPWEHTGKKIVILDSEETVGFCKQDGDAIFTAHAREDIPNLLTEVHRLNKLVDSLATGYKREARRVVELLQREYELRELLVKGVLELADLGK